MDMDTNFSLTFSDDTVLSTNTPNLLEEEESIAGGTVVIIVIVAVLTITLLFGIAIFIDCRVQKSSKIHSTKPRTLFKLRLPEFGRNLDEDEDTFADKIQSEEVYASLSSVA